jgi:hypothetical protein
LTSPINCAAAKGFSVAGGPWRRQSKRDVLRDRDRRVDGGNDVHLESALWVDSSPFRSFLQGVETSQWKLFTTKINYRVPRTPISRLIFKYLAEVATSFRGTRKRPLNQFISCKFRQQSHSCHFNIQKQILSRVLEYSS